jgi:hypothetical protein
VFVWKLDSSGNLAGSGGASAGVTVSKTSASVTEAGGTDSFTVVLDDQPTSNVVIDVASPDTGEATQPAVQRRPRHAEIIGDLFQRRTAPTGHSDHVITELPRIGPGHDDHPSTRSESSD